MDFLAIGKKIRELRKNIGLSQEEVAEGVCTQAQISKIEKGIVYPYASTLYLISQKLGVDVNYFFDIGMTPRLDYIQEVENQLKVLRRNLEFEEMMEIVQTEINNPLFSQNKKNLQLLLWHKGIYQFEVEKDQAKASQTMKEAIGLTQESSKVWSERELEMMMTMGAFHYNDNIEEALRIFEEVKHHIDTVPHLIDLTIITRLYYHLARVLTRMQKLDESIQYCKKGISWCIQKDSMFALGEFNYHIGYNYELKGEWDLTLKYLQKALTVFELQEDDKYVNLLHTKIKGLSKSESPSS
ncbi:helix-turn-helix domain-containing protein [Rossellomorea sp. NPDC077527]|uniref:helix-turn-helix domain-containing protein n=1 Tax=Rossellomorea sp. NPDC077527 TaxID=3364510 RepID=UPI0037C9A333